MLFHSRIKSCQLPTDCEQTAVTADSNFTVTSHNAGRDMSNAATPTKLLLRIKIQALQCQRWKLRKKLASLTTRSKTRVKVERSERNSAVQTRNKTTATAASFMTLLQLSLFRTQMLASQRHRKGMRWATDVKMFALQLQYKSGASYRFLSKELALLSSDTLLKFANSSVGRIQPGFSTTMFRMVGLRVRDLHLSNRQCSLVYDEIPLNHELAYNKFFDTVTGYTDQGQLATHALVLMVRGLKRISGNKQ
jgi:Transposase protein